MGNVKSVDSLCTYSYADSKQGNHGGNVPINAKEIFGQNVRRIRSEIGLSQEELAFRAKLHRTYISSVERGERNVSLENIFAIAEALQVAPGELLKASGRKGSD
jgi:DNA-binding XRE family transcriptional regulator